MDLPEEVIAEPAVVAEVMPERFAPSARPILPQTGPPGRPDTLPEETERPAPVGVGAVSGPEASPPYVKPGRPPRYPNVIPFCVIAGVVLWCIYFFLLSNATSGGTPWDLFWIGTLAFAVLGLLVGLPIQMRLSRAEAKGVVTHMRSWGMVEAMGKHPEKATQNWLIDLCLTDDEWHALVDDQGFQLPVVEVAFRSDRVHGAPVEEGSQAVLKGRWRRDRVEVKDLWHLIPVAEAPTFEAPTVFWGRVSMLHPDAAVDLRYPGEKHLQVLSFRLMLTDPTFEQLQRDAQGNLLAPWPVEIRAVSISGPLLEGDKVEVHGRVVRGTVYSKEVRNHSAGGASLIVKEWAGIPS